MSFNLSLHMNESGERIEGLHVPEQFAEHFKNFLGKEVPVQDLNNNVGLFCNKVSSEDVEFMVRPVTDLEIKQAMFDIDDNKAPGPDGYIARFYKKACSVVGEDVCRSVKEFFGSSKLLGEVNATLIMGVVVLVYMISLF